ncbi:galactitol-1-phosphate 5-dehydrogenase [Microbacterium sediminicola]|uniref:Galactitol-1-phosphate 5-dehydrogenase n=1 Tax=Microbacterium sediminicola TaxID=415210 RepID=A0ABP4UII4_9MICO
MSSEVAYVISGRRELSAVPGTPPEQDLLPGHVLIALRLTGICGSDIDGYGMGIVLHPTLSGHEWVGVIERVAADVEAFAVGDRVVRTSLPACGACAMCEYGKYDLCLNKSLRAAPSAPTHGAYARYIQVPAAFVAKLPDTVTFETGSLVEPATVALHAVRRVRPDLGDTVVVSGAGVVGLTALQLAKRLGATDVILVDPTEERRAIGATLGADYTFAPDDPALAETVRAVSDGRGADVVYECAGKLAAIESGTSLLRMGGRLMLVGIPFTPVPIALTSWLVNEIDVSTSLAHSRDEFLLTIKLIERGWIRTDPITFDTHGLSEIQDVFANLDKGAPAIKTAFDATR